MRHYTIEFTLDDEVGELGLWELVAVRQAVEREVKGGPTVRIYENETWGDRRLVSESPTLRV
jgi:hypothetical protein